MGSEMCIRDSRKIVESSANMKSLYIIGNGGSASISSHFATDLMKAGSQNGMRIAAISLVDSAPVITATSNDFSYEEVFSWQISKLAREGDLLFAISSSGNSANIVKAVELAKELNLVTVSLTGFDGGKVSTISDFSIVTKSRIGNYGPVEDAHAIICHYLSRCLTLYPKF